MPTTDEPNNDDGLTLLDQKRALEDEIWLLAIAENYARGRLKGVLSREEVIAKYYTQYPEMKAYVDDHVARKTCLYGIRELRKRRETNQQALQAQRSTAPPKPARNPEMEWMAPFRAKPLAIVSTVGRPLPPPPWGIPPDDLNRALEALPHEPSEQATNANTTTNAPIYGTGLPGRRSTWFLVEAEVRRRFAPDHASKTTAEWAREMLAWLRDEHPNAPPATEKTLKNRLPGLLRQLKARAK
jgi:hypothetical protein